MSKIQVLSIDTVNKMVFFKAVFHDIEAIDGGTSLGHVEHDGLTLDAWLIAWLIVLTRGECARHDKYLK